MEKIIIVGDLFPVQSNMDKFSGGDIQYLFGEKICKLFYDADYRICNLEGALTDRPGKCDKTGPSLFAPATTIAAYSALGINCCTLANNHITDAGNQGVLDTMNTLQKENIQYLGVGKNLSDVKKYLSFEIKGRNIGLYNVAETMYNAPTYEEAGAHLYDEYIVCKELSKYKKECDYLIVVYHGGMESFRYPSPEIKKRFHRMVDSGADMILSQHTHCIGSEEYYNGAYLLYGQGNFLFRSFNNEFTDTGLILEIVFDHDNVNIKKHLVNAVKDTVRYDDEQDFSSFDERSSKIKDDVFLRQQFEQYGFSKLPHYMFVFKKKTFLRKAIMKIFPKWYNDFLMNSFSKKQLLFILHTVRSEQNRETFICGLEKLLKLNE